MAGETLGRHIDLSSPRGYYLDYSGLGERGPESDAAGVPVARVRGGGTGHAPSHVARAALGSLELYLNNGNPARRDRFESLAGWLVRHMEVLPGSFGGWSMPDVPRSLGGELRQGWFSATAHAECVSVLVRAAALLSNGEALDAAKRAVGAFHTPVQDGGLLREVGDPGDEGGLSSLAFCEEYPVPDMPIMVLTSHIKCLWALSDYLLLVDDHGTSILLDRCVRGLVFVLDRFDLGYWSVGDLDPRRRRPCPVRRTRHHTHALMLDVLHRMTRAPELGETARRWRAYERDPRARMRARLERAFATFANVGLPAVPDPESWITEASGTF